MERTLEEQVEDLQYKYDKYRETAVSRVRYLEKEVEFWKDQYRCATDDAEEAKRLFEEMLRGD